MWTASSINALFPGERDHPKMRNKSGLGTSSRASLF
jgi:hypothetical protein